MFNKFKDLIKIGATSITFTMLMFVNKIYASNIASSQIAKGLDKLLKDLTSWAYKIIPAVGTVLVIYFFIRRGSSDEMDIKKWDNRIKTCVISSIGAVLGAVIIDLAIGYFQ